MTPNLTTPTEPLRHMETHQKKNSKLEAVSAPPSQADAVQEGNLNVPQHTPEKYELILNWYKINAKKLLDEEVLTNLPIDVLLKALGNPIWNDIYHCWAIEDKHFPALQTYIRHQFNSEKFTYFIEAYHNT